MNEFEKKLLERLASIDNTIQIAVMVLAVAILLSGCFAGTHH